MQQTAADERRPHLVDRWRRGTFGPDPDQTYRRRASDCVRVALAAILLVGAALHAGTTTETERAIFDVFNTLPNGLLPLFNAIYRLGALWAVGLVVVSALLGRRWRLARDLLVAGVLAWCVGRMMGQIVVEGASLAHSLRAITRHGVNPIFPSVRAAVVVAVTSAARPYVTRPVRRIGHVLVFGLVIAALYLGNAFPNDLFAGIVLGWGIGALVHLAFGSPGGRPSVIQVARTLLELGVDARNLRRGAFQPKGATLMDAEDDLGGLRIKVIGRDEADAQFLAKLYRFVVYKESAPRLFFTRLRQVEHEAYVTLLAGEGGVRVPHVVVAGKAGRAPRCSCCGSSTVSRWPFSNPSRSTSRPSRRSGPSLRPCTRPASCTVASTPTTSSSPTAVRPSSGSAARRTAVAPCPAPRPTSPSSWSRRPSWPATSPRSRPRSPPYPASASRRRWHSSNPRR